MLKRLLVWGLGVALSGCFQPMKPSQGHLGATPAPSAATIPPPVQALPTPPRPKPSVRPETYSVVVNNVSVRELLFALARDAKVNVDINPGLTGTVTLNAIDQTLPQLLNRIAKQVDMRYELDGPNLIVMPDSPYLRIYKIDYVNMRRETTGQVTVAGNIVSGTPGGGGGGGGASPAGGGASANASTVSVRNQASNKFWDTLVDNIHDILRETDKLLPGASSAASAATPRVGPGAAPPAGAPVPPVAGESQPGAGPNPTFREAAFVIANPEAGVITIRATARQHEKIQEFLDQVLVNAKRQVLIEATVVEVELNNNYQQGINWSVFHQGSAGFTGGVTPKGTLTATPTGSFLTLAYTSASFAASIQLLETFGTVRVVSSPRLSVINNQTAILKVVDNLVYFTIQSQASQAANAGTLTTVTTTPNSVAVGFVMNVTPQISEHDVVLLNVKPTISSVLSFVNDPNPALANPCGTPSQVSSTIGGSSFTCNIPPIVSQIPQIQTRELESVIKVSSGDIAVMGGLIQDQVKNSEDTIPGVNRVPILGNVFANRNLVNIKSELVVFLRPVVIRDASLEGDYRSYRTFVPGEDFLSKPNPGKRLCDFSGLEGCPQ